MASMRSTAHKVFDAPMNSLRARLSLRHQVHMATTTSSIHGGAGCQGAYGSIRGATQERQLVLADGLDDKKRSQHLQSNAEETQSSHAQLHSMLGDEQQREGQKHTRTVGQQPRAVIIEPTPDPQAPPAFGNTSSVMLLGQGDISSRASCVSVTSEPSPRSSRTSLNIMMGAWEMSS